MGINIRRTYDHVDSQDMLLRKLNGLVETTDHPFDVQVANDLITLNVDEIEQHWWSPEMNLRVESSEKGAVIYEVIGPNSSIFTLAMFFVMLGSVTFLAALIMTFSQIYLDETPFLALVGTFSSALLILVTFALLAMGRIKARDQVKGLRTFVQTVIPQ